MADLGFAYAGEFIIDKNGYAVCSESDGTSGFNCVIFVLKALEDANVTLVKFDKDGDWPPMSERDHEIVNNLMISMANFANEDSNSDIRISPQQAFKAGYVGSFPSTHDEIEGVSMESLKLMAGRSINAPEQNQSNILSDVVTAPADSMTIELDE